MLAVFIRNVNHVLPSGCSVHSGVLAGKGLWLGVYYPASHHGSGTEEPELMGKKKEKTKLKYSPLNTNYSRSVGKQRICILYLHTVDSSKLVITLANTSHNT